MTDPRPHLRALADALPAGTAVPVPREWLMELLDGMQPEPQLERDLAVADLCARFGRKPSAVRAWLEQGLFPGAYKLRGRDWRVPAAAVEAFTKMQGNRGEYPRGTRVPAANLGAWRRVRPG